jgi:LysR family hydrogen peroxide-inducible transcriptional activator
MELHQIEYFVAIVETGSFSKAAVRCNVAQPSLSQQIIKLEQEFGTPLFDRMGRTIALTEAGNILYPKAKTILAEVQQARHSVTEGLAAGNGKLSVGIIPTLAPFIIHGTVMRFRQEYPNVELSICEDTTERLLDRLVNADTDICYLSAPIQNKMTVSENLFNETLYLAVSQESEYARLPSIESRALSHQPFIMLHDQHCLSKQTESFCYAEGISPYTFYRTSQLSTAMEFVRSNVGVALVPECAVIHYENADIAFIPIHPNPPQRAIVAVRHYGRSYSRFARAFSDGLVHAWQQLTTRQPAPLDER